MTDTDTDLILAGKALRHYGISGAEIRPLEVGLINHTWLVGTVDGKFILQKVNPMFPADIHQDIDAVTRYLHSLGMVTPLLLRTLDDQPCYAGNGEVWRLYNYLDGITVSTVEDPGIAFEAGALLARFHQALHGLDYSFNFQRPVVHDTAAHLQRLRTALEVHRQHRRYADVLPLATEILNSAAKLPVLPDMPVRKVHGDPKINNFLFDVNTRKGICMLDFDTLANMMLPLELGDAMRSWCNPVGENSTETFFSMENYSAGLQGYLSSAPTFVIEQEWASILPATQIIYIELAARFCADALNENYFSWDSTRFASHSEHSQSRAQGQLNAYKSLKSQIHDAEKHLTDCICCH